MEKPLEPQDLDSEHPFPIDSVGTAPLEVDFTQLNDLCDCARYYYNRYELGIVPIDRPPATALEFGSAIHHARDTLSQTKDLQSALSAFDESYTSKYESLGWEDTLRTPYIGRVMLHAYHQKWDQPKDLYTEIGAAIELGSILYYGRIDYIADDPYNTVTDLKSTSGMIWLPQARLNWQLVGYAYMARELTGIDPKQIAIDGLIVPRLSKKMEVFPPESEYALKIHDNLHRRTAQIYPRDYEEWHNWVKWCVMKITLCRDTGIWPMRAPKACSRFNRVCDYDILCKCQDAEQEQRLRESLFEVDRWHPFAGE
jgi:hypothetical protein